MNKKIIKKLKVTLGVVALSFVLSSQVVHSAVLLTDFNSAIGVDALTWDQGTRTWTGTQVVGTLYNEGTGPFDLTSLLPTAVTASSGLQAEVTAILNTSTPAGSFAITLENSSGEVIVANFAWSDFVVGESKTVAKAFEASIGGNMANWNRSEVASWNLASSGNLTAVNATFTGLSAIPEPTSTSLFVFGLASLFALRRIKTNQSSPKLIL